MNENGVGDGDLFTTKLRDSLNATTKRTEPLGLDRGVLSKKINLNNCDEKKNPRSTSKYLLKSYEIKLTMYYYELYV